MTVRPVCLVTGVGEGTGLSLVRRFVAGGYTVGMVARNEERLLNFEKQIEHSHALPCDLAQEQDLDRLLMDVPHLIGTPAIVIHNAVSANGLNKQFTEVTASDLELNFRVNCLTFLRLAQAFSPPMVERGQGVFIATGNTASQRGIPTYASFAPSKAALRILAESLARDLGPQGVHVAHILIDALIDMPFARTKLRPDQPDDFFAKPDELADEIFRIAHQPRSAWSFNVELRPFGERW